MTVGVGFKLKITGVERHLSQVLAMKKAETATTAIKDKPKNILKKII